MTEVREELCYTGIEVEPGSCNDNSNAKGGVIHLRAEGCSYWGGFIRYYRSGNLLPLILGMLPL